MKLLPVLAMIFLPAVVAAADRDLDGVEDWLSRPSQGNEQISTLPNPGTFLFDRSHGGFMDVGDFHAYLESQGWTWREHIQGTITAELLRGVDVLFFAVNPYIALADSEVAAVDQFLAQGGGLWMVSDYMGYPNVLNQIAVPLGVTFNDDDIGWREIRDIHPHPVTDGVPEYMTWESSCLETTAPAALLARFDIGSFRCPGHAGSLAVYESGLGRAVFQSDATPLYSTYFPERLPAANLRLLDNILTWLVAPDVPVATRATSWGDLKASYR
jgi:hypothetical protein